MKWCYELTDGLTDRQTDNAISRVAFATEKKKKQKEKRK